VSLDDALGDAVDRLVQRHHRRRLARIDQSMAVDPHGSELYATTGSPPRDGNAITIHVDGAQALPAIASAIESARHNVLIAGWYAEPEFRLHRGPGAPTLHAMLADVATRVPVRLLLWAGPPAPAFKPTRRMVRAAARGFARGSAVRIGLDRRERTMHCHHDKIVVVDDETAFVGGIDLTSLDGDRYDESGHPRRASIGWHDAAAEIRGPLVDDVRDHVAARWHETTGETVPAARRNEPRGTITAQFVRTIPEHIYSFLPRGEFTALESYLRALRSAEHFVYLENQFLWSPEIVSELCRLLRDPPRDSFRLVLLLPLRPNTGTDTTRGQLGRLIEADNGAKRLLATTIGPVGGTRDDYVYVHAKIGIVDDRWLTVGSVNLNEHSLFNDTEAAIVTHDETLVRDTRLRLWAEHLQRDIDAVAGEPTTVIDTLWRPIAEEQAARVASGLHPTHPLRRLDGASRHRERLRGPLSGLLVDG
jgi:phosphatidylserine/phosphatidylglycerophosphate/cardiolipin synthase-like enzyme